MVMPNVEDESPEGEPWWRPCLLCPPAVARESLPSPRVQCFVANCVALGRAWEGTAPPIRAVGWGIAFTLIGGLFGFAEFLRLPLPGGPLFGMVSGI